MKKEIGPLQKLQKEADKFKKQVDKQVKEGTKAANNTKIKNDDVKLKVYFKGCYDLKVQIDDLLKQANELSEENEPSKVKDFEKKKTTEVNRVTTWQTQIQTAMEKLLPDDKGVAYLKELKGESEEADEEEDEEEGEEEEGEEGEEEGEDEEEEEEEEEDTAHVDKGKEKPVEKLKIDKKDEEEEEEDGEDDEEDDEEGYDTDEEDTKVHKDIETKKEKAHKEEKELDEEEDEDEDEDEEEDDEEEEEGEEEDEEEDEDDGKKKKGKKKKKNEADDTLDVTAGPQLFEALCDYKGDQQGDLSFKQGEVLTIVNTRDDGWWEAENETGEKGVVPSTFLQAYNKYKDIQKDDEEEEEEEEEGEEGEETGEATTRSGKKMWSIIKKAVHETSPTDVLHALGAIPSGFRPSTLKAIFMKDETYRMKNYLTPKLSKSNLFYRDLFFDPQKSQISARNAKFDRIITIQSCRQIPTPTKAITVKSRYVRVCLFDGQNVLSNIHVVKVAAVDREEKTWSFSTKISDVMDPFQHSEVFVRTNHLPEKLGILFELGFTYIKNKTDEPGEFSCGWVLLDIVDKVTGALIGNKSFDVFVNGGTPYEKNVEVDPNISRRATSSAFMSLLSGNKQPRLNIKVSLPKKEQKDNLDLLPDVLVGNVSLLNIYSYYRQILADTLLKDRVDLESTELIHSPFLATFPEAADQMDLMKILRESWIERTKVIRAPEKLRDIEYMKTEFQLVFQSSVYPLYHISTLPHWSPGDLILEQRRQEEIAKFQKQKADRKGILALLLSPDIEFEPFDMKEVAFNVIGPYCQNDPMTVSVQT